VSPPDLTIEHDPVEHATQHIVVRTGHTFMGLLTCARWGCALTAERKKAKYTYDPW
jgi:hypothetical protein